MLAQQKNNKNVLCICHVVTGEKPLADDNKYQNLMVVVKIKQVKFLKLGCVFQWDVTDSRYLLLYLHLLGYFSLSFRFNSQKRTETAGQSWFALLLAGYVDGLEPLDEFNVIFHLCHLGFQLLSVGFLRHGLRDQRETLVLMVQLIPGLLQTLDTDTGQLQ